MSQRYFLTAESTYESLRQSLNTELAYPNALGKSVFQTALYAPRDNFRRILLAVDTALPGYSTVSAAIQPLLDSDAMEEIDEATYLAAVASATSGGGGGGGVSSWNDLTDRPTEFPPEAHAASHAPNGADELYDQSLNTTDEVTFAEITVSPDATTTATHSGHGVVVTTSPAVEGEPNNERTAYLKTSTSNSDPPAGEFGVVAATDTGTPVTSRITGAVVIDENSIPSAVLTLRAEEPNNSMLSQCYINATADLYGDAAVTMYTTYGNYTGDRYATYGTAGIVIGNNVGGPSEIRIDATGITFPDNTVQTTAWPGTLSYTALTDLPTLGTAAAEDTAAFAAATHGHDAADIADFAAAAVTAVSRATRSDTVGSTTYIGRAAPGSATSASVWNIRRTILTSAGAISSTASATNVKWDDRLTATYS